MKRDKGQRARAQKTHRNTFENSIFFYLCIACDRIEHIVEGDERKRKRKKKNTSLRTNLKLNNTFISISPTNRTRLTFGHRAHGTNAVSPHTGSDSVVCPFSVCNCRYFRFSSSRGHLSCSTFIRRHREYVMNRVSFVATRKRHIIPIHLLKRECSCFVFIFGLRRNGLVLLQFAAVRHLTREEK